MHGGNTTREAAGQEHEHADHRDRMKQGAPAETSAPTLQLLSWLAERPRSYADTIDAWKTSCPRLSVWEDAVAEGLIRVVDRRVLITGKGDELRGLLPFRHVDVFSDAPYAGNGLIVVFGGVDEAAERLLAVAQELRQFETIFVGGTSDDGAVAARIFTVEEELAFAGHPVIGAAAALHERLAPTELERRWTFRIDGRSIPVTSARHGGYFAATMNQGKPSTPRVVAAERRAEVAAALGLRECDLLPFPMQVISTGLPYLIVPVTPEGLERARVAVDDLALRLADVGASFVYVLDPVAPEGRTWDNAGRVEDVATGSAAGPAAAYLEQHGWASTAAGIALRQGRLVGRPSVIRVEQTAAGELLVHGAVAPVATGTIAI
jgi:trans-2,3-dihydro-3-hydroxyanthranilate isomerase